MKYVIQFHGQGEPERITLADPSVGIRLERDEARRVVREVAEYFGVAEDAPAPDRQS